MNSKRVHFTRKSAKVKPRFRPRRIFCAAEGHEERQKSGTGAARQGGDEDGKALGGPRFVAAMRETRAWFIPVETRGRGPDEAGPSRGRDGAGF